jgi:hypothetical protein
MVDLKLDTHKLKDFPGIEVALGWINAAHDYECIFQIETFLDQQELNNEEVQLPQNYSFYFARLRSAQAREAVGLCDKTMAVPELRALINDDQEAADCFNRLHAMSADGMANADMKTIRLVRDTTFHYCMRQHKDWYQDVFSVLIKKGFNTLPVNMHAPTRFSPADTLLNRLFLKEALQMPDLDDHVACGARMEEVTEMLTDVGYEFQVIARAIASGLIHACRC